MAQDLVDLSLNDLSGMHRELAELIGVEGMVKLCAMYGGGTVWIPTLFSIKHIVRDRDIVTMRKSGHRLEDIALKYGVTKKDVEYVLRKARGGHEG